MLKERGIEDFEDKRMARIEIEISPELEARLQPFADALPQILERGLIVIEDELTRVPGMPRQRSIDTAWRDRWLALAREIGEQWPEDVSVIETLAAMRR